MRKLYIAMTAFVALALSQVAQAIPVIQGATDIATTDGQTYFGLMARDNGWFVEGYDAQGNANGFSVQLSPNQFVTPELQTYVGLAFDGSAFHVLRNDLVSNKGTDTWTVASFNVDGSFTGNAFNLGPSQHVTPTQQSYVGLSIADEGFFGLRNDAESVRGTDTWTLVGFDASGAFNGFAQTVDGSVTANPYSVVASFNMSPAQHQVSTNQSVPEPGTGLLLGSLMALGFLGRKLKKA